jgi:hypothetical protein
MTHSPSARFGRFTERTTEPRAMKYARRFGIALAGTFAFFAAISGYRAIVQIYRVDVQAPDTLRAGSRVALAITTSGRVTSSATLVIEQGDRLDTLHWHSVRNNHIGTFISQSLNPFPVHDSVTVEIGAANLAKLESGPATLRAIGLGGSQWMRVPPPTIRERAVVLSR